MAGGFKESISGKKYALIATATVLAKILTNSLM